jgi:ligand-binding sensor domain-containing protein
MTRTRSFILSLLFLSCSLRVNAQWESTNGPPGSQTITALAAVDTNIYAGGSNGIFQFSAWDTTWNSIGLSATEIQAIVFEGGTLFTETDGGISFTNNNGANWQTYIDSDYVFALTSNGSNLVAGTDNGIFISNDSGVLWTPTNNTYPVFALAALGSNLFAGGEGVSLSTDDGATWNVLNNVLINTDILSFAVNGNTLFAGTAGSGVFLSQDNGASWSLVSNGLTDSNIYAITVKGTVASPTSLFVGTDSGVFLSTNNGTDWLAVNDSLIPYSTGVYSFTTDGTYLYAGTTSGVWRRLLSEFTGVTDDVRQTATENSMSAYPNPFLQSATLNFSSSESGAAIVTIVNMLGMEVARIFSGELSAGEHSFIWNANAMTPGMYECVVRMNGRSQQTPIALVR